MSFIHLLAITSMLTASTTFYDFTVHNIDGEPVDLHAFKGKVVLVVNVASFCGNTPQYKQLQELYSHYEDQGFTIAAFPANDFGAQEPGTNAEIKEFCESKFNVKFPMFEKITVKGPNKHPLYTWLVTGGGDEKFAGDIPWNFEKFLIDKSGHVIGRFDQRMSPDDPKVISAIEEALK